MKKYIVMRDELTKSSKYVRYPIAVFYNIKKAIKYVKENNKKGKYFYFIFEIVKNGNDPYILDTCIGITKNDKKI